MKPTSQNARILKYLQSGKTLTGIEALQIFDCLALSQRIANLRDKGFKIDTITETTPTGKRIARYNYDDTKI